MIICSAFNAQVIRMNFPKFSGKSFEFVIFQGSQTIKIQEGIIPPNGIFDLVIPDKYINYVGMSRWLLTNSTEGGGLDMAISGNDFSVTCFDKHPDNSNIIFENYDHVHELNRLFGEQSIVLEKYDLIKRMLELYAGESIFQKQLANAKSIVIDEYDIFVKSLKKNPQYFASFLTIVNITKGITPRLVDDQAERLRLNANFIAEDLNFDQLYTSGHWALVFNIWIDYHVKKLKNEQEFLSDFRKISNRIADPSKYRDFIEVITGILEQYGEEQYIDLIADDVIDSGKISDYSNSLAIYQKGRQGEKAHDLIFDEKVIKFVDSDRRENQKILIMFFQTGCSHCDTEIELLKLSYKLFKKNNIRIIAVAADTDRSIYEQHIAEFPWSETYNDFQGFAGNNFKNYAVVGTPTLFLINGGKIIKRSATIKEILDTLKIH